MDPGKLWFYFEGICPWKYQLLVASSEVGSSITAAPKLLLVHGSE